jgi:hypothetical protein
MALDPSIALGIRPLEVPNQLAQYAQVAQIQSMQNQNQVSQMQLDQMRRDEATLQQIQAKAVEHGGPADIRQIANAYLNSGNPKFIEFGVGLRQKLDERDQIAKIMSMGQTPTVAPTPAAPTTNALAPTMQAGALGSGTFGMAPEPRVNQLAPAVAPAPAANALATPNGASVDTLLAQQNAFIAMGRPELARALDARIALASKEPVYHNVTGVGLVDPRTARVVVPSVEKPPAPPSSIAEFDRARTDPAFMRFLQDRAAAIRPPRPEAAPRTQQVTMSDGTLGIMNMDTGAVTPSTLGGVPVKGKPSAFAEKTTAQRTQMGKDLGFAITQLSDITKDGGLIDQSTGSGAGRLTDIGAGFVGIATPGAIAIGKIAPIADLVLKMVPRFEGPQSNKDTQSYKEAAGQLADASLPTAIRKEAGKTVLRIMTERKNQFVSSDMAAEGAGPAQIAPPAGFVPDQR